MSDLLLIGDNKSFSHSWARENRNVLRNNVYYKIVKNKAEENHLIAKKKNVNIYLCTNKRKRSQTTGKDCTFVITMQCTMLQRKYVSVWEIVYLHYFGFWINGVLVISHLKNDSKSFYGQTLPCWKPNKNLLINISLPKTAVSESVKIDCIQPDLTSEKHMAMWIEVSFKRKSAVR